MKFMHKVILSLVAIAAIAPASMPANSLTRVLAQKITKQAAKQLLKNPGVIAAGLGAASLAYSKWQDRRAQDLTDKTSKDINDSMSPEFVRSMEIVKKHARNAQYGKNAAYVLLGFAGNYFLLSQLKQAGYLPKLATSKAKIAFGAIPAAAMLEAGSGMIFHPLNDAKDNSGSSKKSKRFAKAALRVYPWIGAEMVLGPLAYLALCA